MQRFCSLKESVAFSMSGSSKQPSPTCLCWGTNPGSCSFTCPGTWEAPTFSKNFFGLSESFQCSVFGFSLGHSHELESQQGDGSGNSFLRTAGILERSATLNVAVVILLFRGVFLKTNLIAPNMPFISNLPYFSRSGTSERTIIGIQSLNATRVFSLNVIGYGSK